MIGGRILITPEAKPHKLRSIRYCILTAKGTLTSRWDACSLVQEAVPILESVRVLRKQAMTSQAPNVPAQYKAHLQGGSGMACRVLIHHKAGPIYAVVRE